MKNKIFNTPGLDEALEKLRQYCSYRDRCHKEVRTKLIELKIYGINLENIIVKLVEENFLNEERYTKAYVRGKFKINKWGKVKIQQNLKQNNVSEYCIRKGLEQIDMEIYRETLRSLLEGKLSTIKDKNKAYRYQKLNQFGLQKGYEYALVNELIKELVD